MSTNITEIERDITEIERDIIEMNLSDIEINQLYPIAIEESTICPDAIVIEPENVDTIFYSDDDDYTDDDYTQLDGDYTEQDNDNIEHNNDNNNHDDDENTKYERIFIIFGLSIIIIFLGMIIFMYLV